MHAAKLTKINSKHDNLRSEDILGYAVSLPKKGDNLVMYASSLHPDGLFRQIITSPISVVEKQEGYVWIVTTQNSKYKLELVDEKAVNITKSDAMEYKRQSKNTIFGLQ